MGDFVKVHLAWALLNIPLGLLSLYLYLFKQKPKLNLKNKVVFISGASSGVGKACAEAFFHSGCRLVLSGRDKDTLEAVRTELVQNKVNGEKDVAVVVMDLENLESIPEKVKEAISCFGHVDIVINNAGVSFRGLASDTSLEVYQKVMNINFFGHLQVTKGFLPQMMQRKSGHIVVVNSIQGHMGLPSRTAYSASKYAQVGYFDSLRAELSVYNIDVCLVHPYYVKTKLSLNALVGNGLKYGKMDENQEKGMLPMDLATQIVECVVNREEEKIVCPLYTRLGICLRNMAPSLFFKYMERKAKKEHNANKKLT